MGFFKGLNLNTVTKGVNTIATGASKITRDATGAVANVVNRGRTQPTDEEKGIPLQDLPPRRASPLPPPSDDEEPRGRGRSREDDAKRRQSRNRTPSPAEGSPYQRRSVSVPPRPLSPSPERRPRSVSSQGENSFPPFPRQNSPRRQRSVSPDGRTSRSSSVASNYTDASHATDATNITEPLHTAPPPQNPQQSNWMEWATQGLQGIAGMVGVGGTQATQNDPELEPKPLKPNFPLMTPLAQEHLTRFLETSLGQLEIIAKLNSENNGLINDPDLRKSLGAIYIHANSELKRMTSQASLVTNEISELAEKINNSQSKKNDLKQQIKLFDEALRDPNITNTQELYGLINENKTKLQEVEKDIKLLDAKKSLLTGGHKAMLEGMTTAFKITSQLATAPFELTKEEINEATQKINDKKSTQPTFYGALKSEAENSSNLPQEFYESVANLETAKKTKERIKEFKELETQITNLQTNQDILSNQETQDTLANLRQRYKTLEEEFSHIHPNTPIDNIATENDGKIQDYEAEIRNHSFRQGIYHITDSLVRASENTSILLASFEKLTKENPKIDTSDIAQELGQDIVALEQTHKSLINTYNSTASDSRKGIMAQIAKIGSDIRSSTTSLENIKQNTKVHTKVQELLREKFTSIEKAIETRETSFDVSKTILGDILNPEICPFEGNYLKEELTYHHYNISKTIEEIDKRLEAIKNENSPEFIGLKEKLKEQKTNYQGLSLKIEQKLNETPEKIKAQYPFRVTDECRYEWDKLNGSSQDHKIGINILISDKKLFLSKLIEKQKSENKYDLPEGYIQKLEGQLSDLRKLDFVSELTNLDKLTKAVHHLKKRKISHETESHYDQIPTSNILLNTLKGTTINDAQATQLGKLYLETENALEVLRQNAFTDLRDLSNPQLNDPREKKIACLLEQTLNAIDSLITSNGKTLDDFLPNPKPAPKDYTGEGVFLAQIQDTQTIMIDIMVSNANSDDGLSLKDETARGLNLLGNTQQLTASDEMRKKVRETLSKATLEEHEGISDNFKENKPFLDGTSAIVEAYLRATQQKPATVMASPEIKKQLAELYKNMEEMLTDFFKEITILDGLGMKDNPTYKQLSEERDKIQKNLDNIKAIFSIKADGLTESNPETVIYKNAANAVTHDSLSKNIDDPNIFKTETLAIHKNLVQSLLVMSQSHSFTFSETLMGKLNEYGQALLSDTTTPEVQSIHTNFKSFIDRLGTSPTTTSPQISTLDKIEGTLQATQKLLDGLDAQKVQTDNELKKPLAQAFVLNSELLKDIVNKEVQFTDATPQSVKDNLKDFKTKLEQQVDMLKTKLGLEETDIRNLAGSNNMGFQTATTLKNPPSTDVAKTLTLELENINFQRFTLEAQLSIYQGLEKREIKSQLSDAEITALKELKTNIETQQNDLAQQVDKIITNPDYTMLLDNDEANGGKARSVLKLNTQHINIKFTALKKSIDKILYNQKPALERAKELIETTPPVSSTPAQEINKKRIEEIVLSGSNDTTKNAKDGLAFMGSLIVLAPKIENFTGEMQLRLTSDYEHQKDSLTKLEEQKIFLEDLKQGNADLPNHLVAVFKELKEDQSFQNDITEKLNQINELITLREKRMDSIKDIFAKASATMSSQSDLTNYHDESPYQKGLNLLHPDLISSTTPLTTPQFQFRRDIEKFNIALRQMPVLEQLVKDAEDAFIDGKLDIDNALLLLDKTKAIKANLEFFKGSFNRNQSLLGTNNDDYIALIDDMLKNAEEMQKKSEGLHKNAIDKQINISNDNDDEDYDDNDIKPIVNQKYKDFQVAQKLRIDKFLEEYNQLFDQLENIGNPRSKLLSERKLKRLEKELKEKLETLEKTLSDDMKHGNTLYGILNNLSDKDSKIKFLDEKLGDLNHQIKAEDISEEEKQDLRLKHPTDCYKEMKAMISDLRSGAERALQIQEERAEYEPRPLSPWRQIFQSMWGNSQQQQMMPNNFGFWHPPQQQMMNNNFGFWHPQQQQMMNNNNFGFLQQPMMGNNFGLQQQQVMNNWGYGGQMMQHPQAGRFNHGLPPQQNQFMPSRSPQQAQSFNPFHAQPQRRVNMQNSPIGVQNQGRAIPVA